MKRILFLFCFVVLTIGVYAAPATPLPVQITLADGTTQDVYLRGDEYGSYHTTLDGTPIRIEQGKMITDYTLEEQMVVKRRAARKVQLDSSFPTTGSPRGIVILVNFTDKKFIKTKRDFENLLNESGYSENGAIGSARDYYIASSDSLFQPIFDVYGPYDLEYDMAYYGAPVGSYHDARADLMIRHACAAADADGVDFSQYDYNSDGVVDNVFVYYAGHNQAEGADENTIWPHRSVVSNSPLYDGVILKDYACTSELRYQQGTIMCGIGTFCHEFSHVLGLADLYDIDYTKNTIGNWDLMCSGNYNGNGSTPPSYTAFERFSVGWLTPELLTEPGQYLLQPLATNNKAYMLSVSGNEVRPNQNAEYFLLENRQRVGWDATPSCIPGEGMLIWHIEYDAAIWGSNRPNSGNNLLCYIECAGGGKQTEGRASDPFPGTKHETLFMPVLNNGTLLEKPLLDIQQLGKDIAFTFIRDGNKYLSFMPDTMVTLNSNFTTMADGEVVRTMPAQKLMLVGASLDPNGKVAITTSKSNFQLSLDSINWGTNLNVSPTIDSVLNIPVYLRYRPSMLVCEYDGGSVQAQQGASMHVLAVQGIAPRATLITEPIPLGTTNISPYSAELNWEAVDDASHYYVTIYQLKDGNTSFVQDFEYFDSPSDVALAGWQTNFNSLSSVMKASGSYSLWMRKTGNQVISETYAQPISQLSFWYSVLPTDVDTVGSFLLEGYDGQSWIVIDSVVVTNRDNKKTYTRTFDDTTLAYTQFRLTGTLCDGTEGFCVDKWTAVCTKLIDFLYQGEELTIKADSEDEIVQCYLSDLEPNVEYCYKVQASDRGRRGCEEHVKEMSSVQRFTTLNGKNEERDLTYAVDSIHYSQAEHVIYVPEAEGDRTLYFYDLTGRLVGQVAVGQQENRVAFPEGNFIPGTIYIVKYSVTDKLKRKDRRIKIVY